MGDFLSGAWPRRGGAQMIELFWKSGVFNVASYCQNRPRITTSAIVRYSLSTTSVPNRVGSTVRYYCQALTLIAVISTILGHLLVMCAHGKSSNYYL